MQQNIRKSRKFKKIFKNIEILEWGEASNFDIIINATSFRFEKRR